MNGILNYKIMPFNYINTVKIYITEVFMSIGFGILGVITLEQVPIIVSIIGALGTVIGMPWYFGWRRYKQKEFTARNRHVLEMMNELIKAGEIDIELPLEEKIELTEKFIEQSKK